MTWTGLIPFELAAAHLADDSGQELAPAISPGRRPAFPWEWTYTHGGLSLGSCRCQDSVWHAHISPVYLLVQQFGIIMGCSGLFNLNTPEKSVWSGATALYSWADCKALGE